MKTIAQQINWDFEANGILRIKDRNGKIIYSEYSNGYWLKFEYDSQGNLIYSENSDGYWKKWEYNSGANCIYWEDSNGYWTKYEYDSGGNCIYWRDSNGVTKDNRPKSCEDKVVEIDGVKYKLTKI